MSTSSCNSCHSSLMGKRYVLHKEAPTCLNCYEKHFANKCEKCSKAIGTDAKDLTYKGKHFHETCFLCSGCNKSLANQQFVPQGSDLICTNCYEHKFADKCEGCKKTFKHGMQKVEYGGSHYHYECFICSTCKNPIGDNSFVPNGNMFNCMNCHNDHFAAKCGGCGKALELGGVKFGGVTYHRECFVCTGCKTELAGTKFTTKDDKPFCQDCYIQRFSKRCKECGQPISGLGGSTKFCSFEGSYYHTQCFNCGSCGKNLSGEGFLVLDNQITCAKCGNI